MADVIKMPIEVLVQVGPRNHASHREGVEIPNKNFGGNIWQPSLNIG